MLADKNLDARFQDPETGEIAGARGPDTIAAINIFKYRDLDTCQPINPV